MSEAIVEFDRVSISFGEQPVLKDLSFEVRRGRAFGLLGRSGVGKSVTLRLMIGLLQPNEGRIMVDGVDIHRADVKTLSRVRKRMGFVFQHSALFDSISVGENVAFPLRRHTGLSEADIRDAAEEKLARVGLSGQYDKMPSALSGGMRKRAGLARALSLDPPVLLVDEPSAGLDPITSREIDELLIDLKESRGATLVVVTHNIPSARRIADELAMVDRGRLVARGSAQDFERSEDPVVMAFMKSRSTG
jgi:phospholipid/cholesterol/gamma-HCH transport system ATP-binding protein